MQYALNSKEVHTIGVQTHGPDSETGDGPEGEYVSSAKCPNCKSVIVVKGSWYFAQDGFINDEGDQDWTYVENHRPTFIHPVPRLFTIPNGAHREVTTNILEAFRQVWIDFDLAATCIRRTLETICDSLRIPDGKLHKRLEHLCSDNYLDGEYKDLGDVLIASKWLGNTGTHEIKKVNLLDIQFLFESLELAINRIYGPKDLQRRARLIRERFEKKPPPENQ